VEGIESIVLLIKSQPHNHFATPALIW
jgi:hypothetical protein